MNSDRAILLVNMGGPANPSEVKPYLRSIFSDPAILPLPWLARFPLAGLIASLRTNKVTERYALLGGRSPLHRWTPALRDRVENELNKDGIAFPVSFAFRYSSPTIEDAMISLCESGIGDVKLVPLFPHFTHTMTGSVVTEAKRAAARLGLIVDAISDWGLEDAVIDLWSQYLFDALAQAGAGARVLFVAHGIPLRNVQHGDDYPDRVAATAHRLAEGLHDIEWSLAFQSRVGPVKWTGPYLEDELQRLCKSPEPIVIMPLSFVADCLETIYDLDLIATGKAHELGVKRVVRVPAFNDDPRFARILADLVIGKRHAVLV